MATSETPLLFCSRNVNLFPREEYGFARSVFFVPGGSFFLCEY